MEAEVADGVSRDVVHGEDGVAGEALQQPVVEHRAGTAEALFGRLEDQLQGAAPVRRLDQVPGCGEEHRGVAVVAAGVHAPAVAAAVAEPRGLDDRQRIHVRPQAEPPRAVALAEDADHAGAADPFVHFVAPAAQAFGDQRGGASLLEAQFGMGVDVLAQATQVVGDLLEPGHDVSMSSHAVSPLAGLRSGLVGGSPDARPAGRGHS